MKTIKQTYRIKASVKKVWQALVDPKKIDAWGGGPSKMTPDKGFRFSLWGKDIFGMNIEVEPEKLLKQEWWAGKWDEPSILTFSLSEKNKVTTVKLLHEKVPDSEEKELEKGWKQYYMGPLKKFVESK